MATAYLRVSGKAQIDGDGFPRQQAAIEKCASQHGLVITHTFREEGVSGTTEWGDRPAFIEMVGALLETDGEKIIIVENLTRLARHLRVQENLLLFLASKDIDLISADTGENITQAIREDPMREALIQIQAVFSQLEKKNLVRKLRVARERKKAETGRCEGAKPFGTLPGEAATLQFMENLREQGHTTRAIAKKLNHSFAACPTRNGRPWHFSSVAKILSRRLNEV
jgi:site-specific DNA recombinase